MKSIEVKRAQYSDFEHIYKFIGKLENKTFEKENQRQIFTENLSNKNNIYLVAVIGHEIVGFLSCHVQNLLHHNGLVGEIQEMFVQEESRQLGIGQKLVEHLKMAANRQKVLQLEVTSNVVRKSAHHFYEKQDFRNTHKKFVYKSN